MIEYDIEFEDFEMLLNQYFKIPNADQFEKMFKCVIEIPQNLLLIVLK